MLTKIVRLYTPEFIKKKKMEELFRLTADAFQSEMPEFRGLSFSDSLLKYALFTKEQAERCLQEESLIEEVKYRLYNNSFAFGRNLRKRLHIMSWEKSVTALKSAYKFIGIDFQYGRQGETLNDRDDFIAKQECFVIGQCFFSRYYSAEVCRLISSLDEGLAAGLTGGGILCFAQRITDGSSCCKGCLYRMDQA